MAARISPEVMNLLRDTVVHVLQVEAYPWIEHVRRQLADTPWVYQEALQSELFGNVGGYLVPSIRGLREAKLPKADQRVDEIRRLLESIRELYRGGLINIADHPLVAQRAQMTPERTGSLLAHLIASGGLFGQWTHAGNASAPATQVILTDSILTRDPFAEPDVRAPGTVRGPISLQLRNFRGLRRVTWSPDGVCLVAGPNGSGKTTLLEAFLFLSDAFATHLPGALRRQRGAIALRNNRADSAEGIGLTLSVGDIRWEFTLDVSDGRVGELPEERVSTASGQKVRRTAYSPTWYLGAEARAADSQGRMGLRMAWDAQPAADLKPMVDVLLGYRYYTSYALDVLRQGGKGGEDDSFLSLRGENLFVVLRNWRAAPRRFGGRFDWVLDRIKSAFPGIAEHIEFDPPVGDIVPTRFYPPGDRMGLPMSRAADGFLVGLLHLTAVASAEEGTIIAIDEMENQLHPHAIRSILAAMREAAEERNLTILLTTHSPVLMNAFRDEPNRFFVTQISDETQPIALDKLEDPEWLAHFSLGDLYDRLEIGAPPRMAE